MTHHSLDRLLAPEPGRAGSRLQLDDGARVAVIGGGPAGSFFSHFFLDMAGRVGLNVQVHIYEPRDFFAQGPAGCNMCGGIISESLVQSLAADGINLPPTVIQRGIDSYVLHTDVGTVRIDTPLNEKRIGAVHRGAGPIGQQGSEWQTFDGYLLSLARAKGAEHIPERVRQIKWEDGRPQVFTRAKESRTYDLLVMAVGVNSAAMRQLTDEISGYRAPRTTKTFIREYYLGQDKIASALGSSMHVFLLDIPRLEFAALIPKGDYVSLCMIGQEIDQQLVNHFLDAPEVRGCFPRDLSLEKGSCQCSPRLCTLGAIQPFSDRAVFVGDCGVTRLYKDGIGASYRTAKAAASTAVFQGISHTDFQRYFYPTCRNISRDNQIGKLVFAITGLIQRIGFSRNALLRMVNSEQCATGSPRRMSTVLWDTFTGSAPYQEILLRTIHPAFLSRFFWDHLAAIAGYR